jgi:hypothetical protein
MKQSLRKKFFTQGVALGIAATALSSIAFSVHADDPTPAATALAATAQNPQVSQGDDQSQKPHEGQPGPQHRIDEDREHGFEAVQLIFVGAAIVVALGLAYRAGRRRAQ